MGRAQADIRVEVLNKGCSGRGFLSYNPVVPPASGSYTRSAFSTSMFPTCSSGREASAGESGHPSNRHRDGNVGSSSWHAWPKAVPSHYVLIYFCRRAGGGVCDNSCDAPRRWLSSTGGRREGGVNYRVSECSGLVRTIGETTGEWTALHRRRGCFWGVAQLGW